ncbi:reverse transcriptase domain-containing protein [Tanacetum coccineum]
MDWLSKMKFVIVCNEKVIRIPLEGDETLQVHGERTQGVGKTLMNTKVEFRIDLVYGATPVANSPNRLAPLEMQELSEQLQELQDEELELLRKEKLYAKSSVKDKILATSSETSKVEKGWCSLIPLSHGTFDVLVGMDRLSKRKFGIVCHGKVVRIPLDGDEILQGHDLVPEATPVAKSPYRLAPLEMQELSEQLQELQDEGSLKDIPRINTTKIKRVPYDQRNNPPQHPRIIYQPILNINHFSHFLDIIRNYDPMDDEPMFAANRVVALTPGSAITIPETANEFSIKGLMPGMPNYGKFLKELISNKHKIEQISTAFLSDEILVMIQNKVPPKLGDPGSFLIPCNFNKTFSCNALADLGASINLMPYSLYAKLSLETLKPTKMSVRLADRSFQYPIGIAKNMLIKDGKFTFPVNFVILKMKEDSKVPLILGRGPSFTLMIAVSS